jgi:hypothetical protein
MEVICPLLQRYYSFLFVYSFVVLIGRIASHTLSLSLSLSLSLTLTAFLPFPDCSQAKMMDLNNNPSYVDAVLSEGTAQATDIARKTLNEVQEAVGLR